MVTSSSVPLTGAHKSKLNRRTALRHQSNYKPSAPSKLRSTKPVRGSLHLWGTTAFVLLALLLQWLYYFAPRQSAVTGDLVLTQVLLVHQATTQHVASRATETESSSQEEPPNQRSSDDTGGEGDENVNINDSTNDGEDSNDGTSAAQASNDHHKAIDTNSSAPLEKLHDRASETPRRKPIEILRAHQRNATKNAAQHSTGEERLTRLKEEQAQTLEKKPLIQQQQERARRGSTAGSGLPSYHSGSKRQIAVPLPSNRATKRIVLNREQQLEYMLNITGDSCHGKEGYLELLIHASDRGTGLSRNLLSETLCEKLPSEDQVVAMLGPEPVIVGLEHCQAFRGTNGSSAMPRIAGLYHTGTNALERSFQTNLESLEPWKGSDSRYGVPWGKHMPPNEFRLTNKSPKHNTDDPLQVLPIVVIRNPFDWMQSMCKEWYDAKWAKPSNLRCPAILESVNFTHLPASTPYRINTKLEQAQGARLSYASLPHMWSVWNAQYFNASYPRLMVRFEDLLYRHDQVIRAIRNCAGFTAAMSVRHHVGRAKKHGKPDSFLLSLAKYLKQDHGQFRGMTVYDREYANTVGLDRVLMTTFGYQPAHLNLSSEDMRRSNFAGRDRICKDCQENARRANQRTKRRFGK